MKKVKDNVTADPNKRKFSFDIIERVLPYEPSYAGIINEVSDSLHLSMRKTIWLRKKRIVRLITALPYLSGYSNPREIAVKHLFLYMKTITDPPSSIFRNKLFRNPSKIHKSLYYVSGYTDNNDNIVNRGLYLIGLVILRNQQRKLNKKNKLLSLPKTMILNRKINKYIQQIDTLACREMDLYLDLKSALSESWGNREWIKKFSP